MSMIWFLVLTLGDDVRTFPMPNEEWCNAALSKSLKEIEAGYAEPNPQKELPPRSTVSAECVEQSADQFN